MFSSLRKRLLGPDEIHPSSDYYNERNSNETLTELSKLVSGERVY